MRSSTDKLGVLYQNFREKSTEKEFTAEDAENAEIERKSEYQVIVGRTSGQRGKTNYAGNFVVVKPRRYANVPPAADKFFNGHNSPPFILLNR
jgi:FtsZ-interacting cell division protein YlmF